MMKRKGKAFIDANIVNYAAMYQKEDVFDWINELYEEIYIHQTVMDELLLFSSRSKAEEMLETKHWKLFNPDDDSLLSDDLHELYENYVIDVRNAFRQLDKKKEAANRHMKHTNDLGEIHSLAAAKLFSANIICSNDYDIREVIEDTPITITIEEEQESVLIEQDTLEDFCFYIVKFEIESVSKVRKFFKAIQPEKVRLLEQRINSI